MIRSVITVVVVVASWILMFMGLNWLLSNGVNLSLAVAITRTIAAVIPGLILALLWVQGIISFDPHKPPSSKQ